MFLPLAAQKKYGVLGGGRTGFATIEALLESGASVYAWDDNEKTRESFTARPALTVCPFEEWDLPKGSDIIMAPGIPLTHPVPHPLVAFATQKGWRPISDIELVWRNLHSNPNTCCIAVTGTNGKSTTTALITHLLKQIGCEAYAGGNIGTAICNLPSPQENKIYYILELSSYQLDLCHDFAPHCSVILNMTPDHLDRHGDMQGYYTAKKRLFAHKETIGLTPAEDDYTRRMAQECQLQIIEGDFPFSLEKASFLQGRHNLQNAKAAFSVLKTLGLADKITQSHFENFVGLPHRMEPVGQYNRLTFINDSKATNADATEKALQTFGNVYWILGGVDKAEGIDPLRSYFSKIHTAYLIGQAEERFAKVLEGQVAYTRCGTLEVALAKAIENASQSLGESLILFSPACASFDQYQSYEHRGDHFRLLVQSYIPSSR